MAIAEISDRAQSAREDVTQVTTNELDTADRLDPGPVAVGAILPSEGNCFVRDGNDAGITDSGARHVGTEIFDGRLPGAEGLDVDTPCFGPDDGIDLPTEALEFLAEVTTEPPHHRGQVSEEVCVFDLHVTSLAVEPHSRDEVVDVGVKEKTLVPGVKHSGEPAGSQIGRAHV